MTTTETPQMTAPVDRTKVCLAIREALADLAVANAVIGELQEIADEKQRKVYNIESRILSTLRVIGDPAGLAARFDADAVTRAVEAMEAAR